MSTILAIEDKKGHLISLSESLTTLIPDCHVTTALTGNDGIKKAQTELPDTILLNIKKMATDGFEVCRRLKADERTKHIPIIMFTATKTDDESMVKGLELGADVFLDETIDETVLAAQVKVMIRIKKAEDLLRKEREILEETIQEKSRLEAQLHQARKKESIGLFARGIAHDLNTILGIILGYSELALGDVLKWSPASHDLNEVRKACLQARELVKQILTLSYQSKQEMMQFKIDHFIKESIRLLRASISSKIEIHHNISSKSDTVNADPTQIYQIMLNLCNNAAHVMRENGGVLEITLENIEFNDDAAKYQSDLSPGNYIRLTVSATGHGIDPKIVEEFFDPHIATKEAGEGTVMGLAMVHRIAKAHGGAISVDSEPGKGATVHVYLPAVKNIVEPKMKTIGELPGGNERILLVDNEKAVADTVQLMLERLGYKVEVRTSKIDALKAFRAKPQAFDLVITEQSMSNMTGIDLSKALMRIRPDIPLILCSEFSEVISEEKAAGMGIKALAMKPLVISEIAATIRGVLDGEHVSHIRDPEHKSATELY
jgi:signal transduction histidine kinase